MLVMASELALVPAGSTPKTPPPAYEDLIAICRSAFVDQLAGKEPTAALAALAALPKQHRQAAILVCASYEQGQRDLVAAMIAARAAEAEAEPIPGAVTISAPVIPGRLGSGPRRRES